MLIDEFLKENKTIIHQLSSRVKEERSLSNKIDNKEGKYQCLMILPILLELELLHT